ncbi:flavin reductase family protein [Candidatus Bathyarchaeota archaeon]|nr:flavin reductase family protein [Candidatus Bathyarchaeota archaeon]
MKRSLGAKTWAVPAPVWVVGTFDANGKPNFMTAAWGGICCSDPPCIYVSLREATYTFNNLVQRGAYTVSVPGEEYWREVDYMGIVSGHETDKVKDTDLTAVSSEIIDAPYVDEFPLVLECRLINSVDLGLHTQFIGEIIDVKADEEVLIDGKPDIQKIKPFIFGPSDRGYHSIGPRMARAFSQRELEK